MYNPILKFILLGIGVGIALLALPFILKIALFILLFGMLFRFASRWFFWRRFARVASIHNDHRGFSRREYGRREYGHRWYNRYKRNSELHPAFADTIRNMTDDEYGTFRQKLADDRPTSDQKTTIEIQ